MIFVSFHFPKLAFLFYFTLNQYAIRAQRWQFREAHDLSGIANSKELQWLRNSLGKFCGMNNRQRFLEFLGPILVPRLVGTESHKEVAGHLSRTLSALGFTIEWDLFEQATPHGNKLFRTLIATHDPNVPKRLILACHYDSKFLEGEIFIGATDSAVPCAMLLEMAYTLGPLLRNRQRKDVTLQLIFFDGEEAFDEWSETDSLYGSRHLASKWSQQYFMNTSQSSFKIKREIDRIDLFVLLDLLGASNPHFYCFNGFSSESAFMELVKIEMELMKIGCLHQLPQIFQPRRIDSRVEDDHVPFLNLNVPVLHLIPLPFPDVWHKASDNASVLHYETIDNLNSILRVFISKYYGLVA
uniref:Glutaminyl-peptide cyclotransferase n=1 Tax=Elaeophora elaphi TaxID=1147741 RepID=A0A158Q703_9BILA